MKLLSFFIMALLTYSLNVFGEDSLSEQYKKVQTELKNGGYAAKLLKEQNLKDESPCTHCPRYVDLTAQVNKIVTKLKDDPAVKSHDELPVEINRLKFLYYTVRMQDTEGNFKCHRYQDVTPDLKPTRFDGEMQLMAQDVFKFPGITQLQVLRPETDEVTYYYRGEGDQKDIIIQAVLTKEGGHFRYYKYTPSVEEKNPYNLPDLGNGQVEKKAVSPVAAVIQNELLSDDQAPAEKSSTESELKFKPKLKNLQVAEGKLVHEVSALGLKVDAKSNLSLNKGNNAQINFSNENGNIVEVNLTTKLNGKTEHKIVVPYYIKIGETNGYKVSGYMKDEGKFSQLTLSFSDEYRAYFNSEYIKNKEASTEKMSIGRTIAVSGKESVGVSFGKDEMKERYVSFSHRKNISENITIAMDIKVSETKKATLYYQLKARF